MHKYILFFGMSLTVGCDPPESGIDLPLASRESHLHHVHHSEDERRGCGEDEDTAFDTGEVYWAE